MAAVRIESYAFGDLRFEALARAAGLADADHALGKMMRLWRACTDRQVYILEEAIVAVVIDPEAVIGAGLGERVAGGVRIRGTKGKIEWLAAKRKAARKGGAANKAKWNASGEPNGYPPGKKPDSPTATAPAPAPAKAKRERGEVAAVEPPPPQPPSEHQAFIAEFDALYAEHNAGARPTWGSRQGKVVAELLRAHGLEECRRRAGNMFRAPPQWPPPPHDLATLAKHFDLFAKEHRRTGGHFAVTGTETYAGGEVKL